MISPTSDYDGCDHENAYEYLFGFGSIMNTSTHAPWLKSDNDDTNSTSSVGALPGRVAILKKSFGYTRQWNFRSTTGFTALGISLADGKNFLPSDVNGVLFQVPISMMPGFDKREVGYDKVAIKREDLELEQLPFQDGTTESVPPSHVNQQGRFELGPNDRIWIYVPIESQCKLPDENHPLLQSYVDTVLQGCLEWGGEAMAEQFIVTTGSWSAYFLNDTPSSRRPWLFRKQYDIIDKILQRHADRTFFRERRHPEEFATAFHRHMRGMWSIPRRNSNFTGRDAELGQLHARLRQAHHQDRGGSVSGGWIRVEVAGMGGVGKTQLCVEYCYRHFPSDYGLIIWLTAESSEALVADYRQLLADLASEDGGSSDVSTNKDTDEIIGEVKTRLFRSQVPWLLVFDNLDDRSLLDKFVPRGAGMKGHVLVTTRLVEMELGTSAENTLVLGCFNPTESVELLRRAAPSNITGQANEQAANQISYHLGHLPLALGMAAAYMQRCDVNCAEYLERYVSSEKSGKSLLRHGKLQDYSLTVAASLSLSLVAIQKESETASDILRLLCYLGPDQITKGLLRSLLNAKANIPEEPDSPAGRGSILSLHKHGKSILMASSLVFGGMAIFSKGSQRRGAMALALVSLSVSSISSICGRWSRDEPMEDSSFRRKASFTSTEFEQADIVWNILKSYSLLTVKEGKASMHRLLAESLRVSQTEVESRRNLRICIEAIDYMWKFKPDKPETWKEALQILEHAKAVISRSVGMQSSTTTTLKIGRLSVECGVFSAMSLNAFIEAQASLELALKILDQSMDNARARNALQKTRAEALHELGKVFRYQGNYSRSEQALMESLNTRATQKDSLGVADTLHELGVLEIKKHQLESAASFLRKSLAMRRELKEEEGVDAQCAATLHQLALVQVAKKPPSLDQAEMLLQEALGLSRQIAQRAATLKQLARVTIRRGLLDRSESYLGQALELYKELYGDAKHINIAAVKFQQGALAVQREEYEQAWLHYSECLRIRRHVYAYARTTQALSGESDNPNPTHLEVSCVVHELGCVAFAQSRFAQARAMLEAEGQILERLEETTSTHPERLFQARLTNLTWLRKCAKKMGEEEEATRLASARTSLKKNAKHHQIQLNDTIETSSNNSLNNQYHAGMSALQQESVRCRLLAREFALLLARTSKLGDDVNNPNRRQKSTSSSRMVTIDRQRQELLESLKQLQSGIKQAPGSGPLKQAATAFCDSVLGCLEDHTDQERRTTILTACDVLRYG